MSNCWSPTEQRLYREYEREVDAEKLSYSDDLYLSHLAEQERIAARRLANKLSEKVEEEKSGMFWAGLLLLAGCFAVGWLFWAQYLRG